MTNSFSKLIAALLLVTVFFNFTITENNTDDPKSKALIKALYKANGGWAKLAALKDVQYTYVYNDAKKGTDISIERYIFSDETSWGKYTKHEANVMPDITEGIVKQCYMGGQSMISHDGNMIKDPAAIGGTEFLRRANYFWFTMMHKLDDPGAVHKYLGQETVNGINYDKMSLSYNAASTGKEVNDEYILYFNPKTSMVDIFYFSLPALGVNQPALKMELEYTRIKGIPVSTTRKVSFPDDKGNYAVGLEQTTKDVKFNNGFTAADMKL